MKLTALSATEVAELNARLLAIDIVSWRWNDKGLALHEADGNTEKLKNEKEVGVIAQTVQKQLADLFPEVSPHHPTGALMVDYGILAEVALAVLPHLDKKYQEATEKSGSKPQLRLKELLKKYDVKDYQLRVVRLLALVNLYNQKTDALKQTR